MSVSPPSWYSGRVLAAVSAAVTLAAAYFGLVAWSRGETTWTLIAALTVVGQVFTGTAAFLADRGKRRRERGP